MLQVGATRIEEEEEEEEEDMLIKFTLGDGMKASVYIGQI
jgi:hypothetical protein